MRFLNWRANAPQIGDMVRVKQRMHCPRPGEQGAILSVSPADPCGAYLVLFGDRLRFRYRADELELIKDKSEVAV